ncbi:hypothetical protein V6N12_016222 [Hibiscus sabdariffa]|uniref:Uncharacterized protein n=1 Tax=Hibiscus sabdariffa TaxID=183260 RepID=A0ABR2AR18_9ROSI
MRTTGATMFGTEGEPLHKQPPKAIGPGVPRSSRGRFIEPSARKASTVTRVFGRGKEATLGRAKLKVAVPGILLAHQEKRCGCQARQANMAPETVTGRESIDPTTRAIMAASNGIDMPLLAHHTNIPAFTTPTTTIEHGQPAVQVKSGSPTSERGKRLAQGCCKGGQSPNSGHSQAPIEKRKERHT